MVFAHDRHDHADGELGNGLGGVSRDADDLNAEAFGGEEVDVVVTSASEGDVFLYMENPVSQSFTTSSFFFGPVVLLGLYAAAYHSEFRQPFQNLRVADIVDEDTHRIVTRGQGEGGMIEWDLEKEKL